ncbi:MAG: hypothetical protein N2511_07085 [Thermodesulfovibrionales bacterium]|nr:hypothetical protein [Thermodesulfovibrionales bacterium]
MKRIVLLFFLPYFLICQPLSLAEKISTGHKYTETSASLPLKPFKLERDRIIPGTIFQIEVNKEIFDREKDKISLSFIYRIEKDRFEKRIDIKNINLYQEKDRLFIEAKLPEFREIEDIKTQAWWKGMLSDYNGDIEIKYRKTDGRVDIFTFPVRIPSVKWAYIWGIVFVILSFFIISWLKPDPFRKQRDLSDKSREEWEKIPRLKRFFLYPLNFAITPMCTYSISLTQILIWTYVTIFGLVYVYWLTGSFLDITSQVLMLLGISGGTAAGAKIVTVSRLYEVPSRYLNLVVKSRIPKLKDIISTDGRPNIYKFQMLMFTLLTAYIAVVEITKKYSFPQIPDSLVILMGISSTIYISHEIIQENVWDKIKKKIEEIESYAKDKGIFINTTKNIENLGIPQVDELKNLLEDIYS